MKTIFLSIIMIFVTLGCNSSTNKCNNSYLQGKQNYIEYGFNYDESLANTALKQINQSLKCNDNLEEKLSIKLSILLFLKKFDEARKLAYEYGNLPKFSYGENKIVAVEYVNLIECFDKSDKECMKQKVNLILRELEKKKNKDVKYYMTYFDLRSYVDNKEIMKREISQNSSLSIEQKQLLTDFVEYNDSPLGPYAVDGPFLK